MAALIACCQFLTLSPRAKAWLKKQLIQLDLYETRVGKVEDVVEKLKKKRDSIQNTVDEEERRHGRKIHVEVKEWMHKVDKLILIYRNFHNDEICHKCAVFEFFESGFLPKPGIRYRRSRKADDITKQANGLLQNAKFDILSYWSGPPSMAAFFSNLGYESYSSRNDTVKKITDEFQKPGVRMIGLHGLSGVGKTSLVKEVVKKALKDKMFEVVTMASMTKNPDVSKIQGQIADMLGVVLEEESDIARAARIHQILNDENKSTLIILDDLWEEVNFNLLGIPRELEKDDGIINVKGKSLDVNSLKNFSDGKSPVLDGSASFKKKVKSPDYADSVDVKKGEFFEGALKNVNEGKPPIDASDRAKIEKTVPRYKGCKILMISEIKQVLLNQMEGKEEYIFPVEVLKEKEAEMLFKKKAGIDAKNSEYDKLAAQIASKCKGLPMTIVTTARALKNKSLSIWDETNRKLESQNLTGAPEFSTRLSYELLEDAELKYTFLLCARMGHDALIMNLVKYCIGFGFLRGINTARQTRDKVHTLVAKLKELGMLSDSYSSDHFTMPDTVRRAALSIAYEENHLFTMTKEKVDEWPDELEQYAAISLHHCNFIEEFPATINYPRLRVLEIVNNISRSKMPKNFFKGVKELRVLILTGIHLPLIDSSISSLHKLRMLCLEQCRMQDEELSIIGELNRLRILSFSGSNIKSLPNELNELKMLQIFDISNCSKLKKIPYGVISSLVSLEELYMRNTSIQWEDEDQSRQSKITLLSDLKHLNQLTALDIQIPNVSYLPKNLFFDNLYSYKIIIGDLSSFSETDFKMPEKYEMIKFLAIQLKNGSDIHSLKGIKMLFEGVENLFLELNSVHEKRNSVHEAHNIVHDLFYRLNLKGFPCLKHLWIVNNSTLQSLIHPKDRQEHEKAFPKLESLSLHNVKMDEICSCKLSEPSFGKLKVIKISLCGELKNVFSISMVILLKFLETIEVSECNSLKEIIDMGPQSNPEKTELLMLPELRHLKLQSLCEFVGFDAIPQTGGEERKLFHEKVRVSKLERLELSSIQIDVIWSVIDQSSKRLSFENLTHLDVNGCWKLKYLMSLTMAKSLVNLQSLYVSDCEKMRSIFLLEQNREKDVTGNIFPKLKNMKLCSMKSLSQIWNPKLASDSFSKLDTLIIEECDKLENVMEGIFVSICNLRVTNCMSMQAIFNIREQVGDAANNLQDVHLETLPKLKLVWKMNYEDRVGIPKFNNLKKIWAQDCHSLEYIFPFSVAMSLDNLESLVVCDCYGLSVIVAERETTNTDRARFNFAKLSTIKFSKLPELTSFCPTTYDLSCPLNELSIELCDNLEPFSKGTEHAQRNHGHVFFPKEVINNLKSMQIESWHAKSPSSYMGKRNHRRNNLEELSLSRLMDTDILYSFLHRNPNLKSLLLNNCFFEKIVPPKEGTEIENLGVVPNLKSLTLIDLPNLKEIGFEPDIILERLELLILKNCPCMITIAPSSVSFTRLTNLEVVNCDRLQSLMSASTAKTLVQLKTMKVVKCESMMEIVRKDGEKFDRVVFQQLKTLELVSLKKLKSFCVSDCGFEFPSLEKLVVSACYNMAKFSETVTISPILQNIHVVHGKENKRLCWEGDINATIKKIFEEKKFFEGMEEMSLSQHKELHKSWKRGAGLQEQNSQFYSLKILKLENCVIRPCAIPSNILPYLRSVKELQVRGCNNVRVIFEMNAKEGTGTTFQLQKLILEQLPKLENVWESNGKGTESFQNLKLVHVSKCEKLQTVFPFTLAKNLKKLVKLEIVSCGGLYEIVKNEGDTTTMFVLPCLTTLYLCDMPELIYFYRQSFTLDCSALNTLAVVGCPELELFGSANRQSIFFDLKDICNIEVLLLDWQHILVLRTKLGEPMDNLESLNHIHLCFLVDENERPYLPIQILQKMPNLTQMSIYYCSCLEVFQTQISEIDEKGVLTHLKTLTLDSVSKLQSIGSEDSPWLNVICDSEKLQELHVIDCPDLKTLVHSTPSVSFTYVKKMYINNCKELKYLFTLSSVNKLENLEHIEINGCESMEAIVLKEEKDIATEIKLQKLRRMDLTLLPKLEYFYSSNDTLHLPCLTQVGIWMCPKMEFFSGGEIHLNSSFRGIQASNGSSDDLVFYHDLNSSVEMVFLQQEFFKAVGKECFSDNLELQTDIRCKTGLQNNWLANLETLKLQNCKLSYAIPSSILCLLNNLKELEVRDSDKVKAIFDMNDDTEIKETESQLKILTLNRLSELTHVWEKDTHRILIFRNLQEVVVSDCSKLPTLFPASLAKCLDDLKKLKIDFCENLHDFVEQEETTFVTEKFVFPCLEDLELNDLPQVTCPKTFTLEFPSIKFLSVRNCDELGLFQSVYDPMGEGTSSSRLPLISDPKVISNLEKLTLDCKQILALSLWFKSQKSTEGLTNFNTISLSFFGIDGNEVPMLPNEILKAPNLIELDMNNGNNIENFLAQNPKIGEEEMLRQLTILRLCNVSTTQFFELEYCSSLNIICERLHKLTLSQCPHLTTILRVHSAVSFSCLKELNIYRCPNLKYLFTSSAAKDLMNLEEIRVTECETLTEIVSKEGDASSEGIKFDRLHTIYLQSLTSLVCFYSGSDNIELSSLKTVAIRSCPNMEIFSHGNESLMGVALSTDQGADDVHPPQDLNTRIKGISQRKKFFEAVDKECFSDNIELQEDLQCNFGLQNQWLGDLVTLKLQNCTLPCAIPSVILSLLKSLKELEVRDSATIEVLFYMNDNEIIKIASQLRILTLERLSKLTQVWEKKKNGVLMFPNLQRVIVRSCKNLQTLFPASLAKNLRSLKNLKIECCAEFREIVEKEEDTEANFVLPCLEKLALLSLPQLNCFYAHTFTLECPALNKIYVSDCDKLELFQGADLMGEVTSVNRKPLISSLEVISNLKSLQLDWKHILVLRSRLRSKQFSGVFKFVNEMILVLDGDKSEIPIVLNEILHTTPNLKKMGMIIDNCNTTDTFLGQYPKIGEDGMLLQLRELTLFCVSAIRTNQSENSSWLNTIFEKVHEMHTFECPNVEKIGVHSTSTMSFCFLKEVCAYQCPQFQYLFTSSVAKELVNLKEITVVECESLKEIVAKEEDEDEPKGEGEYKYENEMIFMKLEELTLVSLDKLESFYTGSSTLNFPSLRKVVVRKCLKAKIFRHPDKVPLKFRVIIDGICCSGDKNALIMQQFEEEAS
ncbi:uncharacterized protein LOC114166030 [Vigna unguiculata]|uniref:uncharacterized protein LOC114166030 n=1 Tax=Vigna unguiculata TaxID=3917 RepID=UPI001016448C|nr:uncharacterized protein LOC114166030 [Vigna unguiculata]XP_027906485.1 uncharacterized protein LOC114166030 [Vigna unguiculata]